MSEPNFRALCAELVTGVDNLLSQGESPANPGQRLILTVHVEDLADIADRARAALAAEPQRPMLDGRDPECVARWPECFDGGYDPRCCRFPKSCSCGG